MTGVRILDLTRILAGPFATMLLGDYGAEVIKVEVPGGGDDTRRWGPPFPPVEEGEGEEKKSQAAQNSAYYLAVNRNKLSVTCDLKQPGGREVLRRLAAHCDVVVHNFVPGKEKGVGADYESLSQVNPRLIYCSFSPFETTVFRS